MYEMYRKQGISEEVLKLSDEVLASLKERFDKIDDVAEYNQMKVIKAMQDAEYIVYGIEEGTATYNNDGSKVYNVVSAIKILHKDNVVSVGSGLSKEQRLRWLEHPEEIIGKTVTIQYFEETVDSKIGKPSLRFPVLKHVYEDGRNV